jgi:hypothetical protein
MKLNIGAEAAVFLTNKLEKMHRSALPNAVRGALNKAAFDVKQNTMPKSARGAFVNRQPNFFKANSKVEMAKGWDVKAMKATVGFTSKGLKGPNNYAVDDLEEQERGGVIRKRSFIPTDAARGGSNSKVVRPANRLDNINRIVNANRISGRNKRESFMKAVRKAGVGGYVLGNNSRNILYRIESIRIVRGKTRVKKKAIYSFKENRSVKVSPTNFMRKATMESGEKINDFFVAEANRQISRL